MKTIKVSEANELCLNWLVAKCEGALYPLGNVVLEDKLLWIEVGYDPRIGPEQDEEFDPCHDWAQGGPIIEREKINHTHNETRESGVAWLTSIEGKFVQYGPTPLIAAMRCYVASKLGEVVEVPEELCK